MAIYQILRLKNLNNIKKYIPVLCKQAELHTSPKNLSFFEDDEDTKGGPRKWLKYNDKVYPPQAPGEEPRPAFVCHQRTNIKYSPWKMWYIACMVRGMSVDEAIRQLKFVHRKGAQHVREVIEEAKEIAKNDHNVEYPSNMWVAESFSSKGLVYKGMRRHARMRVGRVEYFHCHYFVRLEEGKPPLKYYNNMEKAPKQQFDEWLEQMRKRKITNSL